jgi:hypothetical protein
MRLYTSARQAIDSTGDNQWPWFEWNLASLEFSDVRHFSPGTHPSILLLRPRSRSRQAVLDLLSRIISKYPFESLQGCLVVADENQTRIRRPNA